MSKHTPGPWRWFGHAKYGIYLATTHSGRRFVMDFVRQGMRGAQPRFQPRRGDGMIKAEDLVQFEVGDQSIVGIINRDPSVYRLDVRGIDSADARLIALSPEMYEALVKIAENPGNLTEQGEFASGVIAREIIAKAEAAQ